MIIRHGPRDRARLALTFDADLTPAMLRRGGPEYDPRIVAELQRTSTPATFFVSGLWARTHPDELRSIASDPLFEIGNHTLSHLAFAGPCFGLPVVESEEQKRFEVTGADSMIAAVTEVEPRLFRFPGGCYGAADLDLVDALGKRVIEWDVDSKDAFETEPGHIVKRVLNEIRPGSIVVMHLNGPPNAPATAAALATLIPALRERGYEPLTVSALIGAC